MPDKFSVVTSPLLSIFALLGLFLVGMFCKEESQKREIRFIHAFALCLIITPILAYFVITNKPLKGDS